MKASDLKKGDLIKFKGFLGCFYEVVSVYPLTTRPQLRWREKDLDHCDVYRKVDEAQEKTG